MFYTWYVVNRQGSELNVRTWSTFYQLHPSKYEIICIKNFSYTKACKQYTIRHASAVTPVIQTNLEHLEITDQKTCVSMTDKVNSFLIEMLQNNGHNLQLIGDNF